MSKYHHTPVASLGKIEVPQMENPDAYDYWIDGVPVVRQLHTLCVELRKKLPQLQFHASSDGNKVTNKTGSLAPTLAYSDVTVYMDDCEYVLGRVGYGKRYGASESDEAQYMIESRKINNEKYNSWRDQYHRKFCKDGIKAVKLARTYLIPYSAQELAVASVSVHKGRLDAIRSASFESWASRLNPLRNTQDLLREVEHLVRKGVEFSTPVFKEHAAVMVQAHEEYQALENNPNESYFISVRMVGDVQWVDIAECAVSRGTPTISPVKSMPSDDLPEDIKGKVATLMLLNVGEHVQGVGTRATTRTFWVTR